MGKYVVSVEIAGPIITVNYSNDAHAVIDAQAVTLTTVNNSGSFVCNCAGAGIADSCLQILLGRNLTNVERPLWVVVSIGRRNTCTKPRHSGFGPEGLTRLTKVLEKQLIAVNERVAREIGSRRESLSEQAIRVVVGTRLPVFPRIGTRRPFESLAITLIQRYFRQAMAFRQSVASTG